MDRSKTANVSGGSNIFADLLIIIGKDAVNIPAAIEGMKVDSIIVVEVLRSKGRTECVNCFAVCECYFGKNFYKIFFYLLHFITPEEKI